MSGVAPKTSAAFTSAPAASRAVTAPVWPLEEASSSGDCSMLFDDLTRAPRVRRDEIRPTSPRDAARNNSPSRREDAREAWPALLWRGWWEVTGLGSALASGDAARATAALCAIKGFGPRVAEVALALMAA